MEGFNILIQEYFKIKTVHDGSGYVLNLTSECDTED